MSSTPTPLLEALSLEPNISVALAKELKKCGCSAPTNLQIQIHSTTSIVSLTTPPTVESSEYNNYVAPMTAALLGAIPESLRNYTEFRQTPIVTPVVIHNISLASTTNDPETLKSIMKECQYIGYQIKASSVRFLQKDAKIRSTNRTSLLWYQSLLMMSKK